MNTEIKYDYIRIDDDIKNIKQLKSKLPIAKGKLTSYEWDYLYTGYSKGDTIDALIDLYTQTCNRMIAIDQLLDIDQWARDFVLKEINETCRRL